MLGKLKISAEAGPREIQQYADRSRIGLKTICLYTP